MPAEFKLAGVTQAPRAAPGRPDREASEIGAASPPPPESALTSLRTAGTGPPARSRRRACVVAGIDPQAKLEQAGVPDHHQWGAFDLPVTRKFRRLARLAQHTGSRPSTYLARPPA